MVNSQLTHISINADDVDESVRFYTEVFGLEPIPTPNYGDPIQWLKCGNIHIHLVEKGVEAPSFYHFALHVDDFEGVYKAVEDFEMASFDCLGEPEEEFDEDGNPPVYCVKSGAVQLYVRDPAGNEVEINYPAADELDRTIVKHLVEREEAVRPPEDRPPVRMYADDLLDAIDRTETIS